MACGALAPHSHNVDPPLICAFHLDPDVVSVDDQQVSFTVNDNGNIFGYFFNIYFN